MIGSPSSYLEWRASLERFSEQAAAQAEHEDNDEDENGSSSENNNTDDGDLDNHNATQPEQERFLKVLEGKKDVATVDAAVARNRFTLPGSSRVAVVVPTMLPLGARCALVGALRLAGKEVAFLTSSAGALAAAHREGLKDVLAAGYGEARLLVAEVAEGACGGCPRASVRVSLPHFVPLVSSDYLCVSRVTGAEAVTNDGNDAPVATVRVEAASGTAAVGLADADAAFAVAWIAGLLQRARAVAAAENDDDKGASSPATARYAASEASSSSTLWRSVSSADLDGPGNKGNGKDIGGDHGDGMVAGSIGDQLFRDAEAVWRALAPAARLACRQVVRAYRNYTGEGDGDGDGDGEGEAGEQALNTEQAASRLLAVLSAEVGLHSSGVSREVAAVARLALMAAAGRYYGRRALRRRHLRAAASSLRHHLQALWAPAEPYDAVLLWTDSPGLAAALAHQRQRRDAPTAAAAAAPMHAFARCLLDVVREEAWRVDAPRQTPEAGAGSLEQQRQESPPPMGPTSPALSPADSPAEGSSAAAAAALPLLVAEAPLRALSLSLGAVDAAAASLSSLPGASADVARALFGSPAPTSTPARPQSTSASPQSAECPVASLVAEQQQQQQLQQAQAADRSPATSPVQAVAAPRWAMLPPSALADGASLLAGGGGGGSGDACAAAVACFGGVAVAAWVPQAAAVAARCRVFDLPTPPRPLGVCVQRHRPDGAADRSSVVWLAPARGPPRTDAYHLALLPLASGGGASSRVDVQVLVKSTGANGDASCEGPSAAPALFWGGDDILRAGTEQGGDGDDKDGNGGEGHTSEAWASLGVCILGGARHEGDAHFSVAVVELPAADADTDTADGKAAGADAAPQLLIVLPMPSFCKSAGDGALPATGLDLLLGLESGGQGVPMAQLRPRRQRPPPQPTPTAAATPCTAAHKAACPTAVAVSRAGRGHAARVGGPWDALGALLRVATKLCLYAALLLLPWALPATVLFLNRQRAPPELPTLDATCKPQPQLAAVVAPPAAAADLPPAVVSDVATNATDALPSPFPIFPIRVTIISKKKESLIL